MTALGRPVRHLWRLSALRLGLWVLIAAGPLLAASVWVRIDMVSQQLAHVVGQATAAPAVSTADVEGVAQLVLADLLTSAGDADRPRVVVETVSLGAEELDPGYYAVTVAAAQVEDAAVEVRFYVLGVISTSSGWAVSGSPALVGGPTFVDAAEVGTGMRRLDPATGLIAAVEGFVVAFLVGDGDVARYTAPGSALTAVSPPPFSVVEVTEAASTPMESGGQLVVVGVEGTRPSGRIEVLEYWLVVEERDGRWEVADLLPAPPLDMTSGREEE